MSGLARRIGVEPAMVSKWTRGRVPDQSSVGRIADALGADVDHLLVLAGHRPRGDRDENPALNSILAKLEKVELNDERQAILIDMLEGMLRRDRRASQMKMLD